jgi:translocation and assembly module TamB
MTQQGKPLTLLELDGKVPVTIAQLRDGHTDVKALPLAMTLSLPKTSAPQILNVLGRTDVTTGTLDGKVTVSGTIGKPVVAAHVVGRGIGMRPGPHGKQFQAIQQLTVDASYDEHGGKVTIDGTEDRGGKLRLEAAGSPAALSEATAKITATRFDMSPVLAFAPGPAGGAQGTLDANVTVRGFDLRTAKILGDLHIRDARVPIAPTVGTLRKANIDIAIREHDIKLTTVGKLGGGDVKVDGTVALDGVALSGGEAKITLRKISPVGSVEPQIDADITAKIARKGTSWNVDAVVDNGFVKVTKSSGEKLKPAGNPSDLTIGAVKPKPPGTERAAQQPPKQPAITVVVTLHGKVTMTADAQTIGMVGTIEAESGDLDLFDRRYRLERAAVTFDGTVDPRLDVQITHDFPDVTTVTKVHGRMSKPKLELSSNPGIYSQSQLLGFLLGGEPSGDPNSGSARDKAQEAGTSFIANQIGGYFKKALPFDIDVIRYEAASVSSSAAITVGSWITHTLFFAFRQHLDARPDENSGEGTLEYWLTRRLEVEATAGDRNYDGLDILWRKRF